MHPNFSRIYTNVLAYPDPNLIPRILPQPQILHHHPDPIPPPHPHAHFRPLPPRALQQPPLDRAHRPYRLLQTGLALRGRLAGAQERRLLPRQLPNRTRGRTRLLPHLPPLLSPHPSNPLRRMDLPLRASTVRSAFSDLRPHVLGHPGPVRVGPRDADRYLGYERIVADSDGGDGGGSDRLRSRCI